MMPSTVVSDPDYARLKDHLIEATGLAYYADKDEDLAGRITRRFSELGVRDCASYIHLLLDQQNGDSELDALIAELTIGETYFFRDHEQFEALRAIVFPDLLNRNRDLHRLHIWSAGCAIGAEPYSVAVLLRQEFAAGIAGWDVNILGTDLNRRFLSRACEGRFEDWAFRSVPDEFKRRYFRQTERSWTISPEYKEWVSFQYHNLVKHSFPSLVNNLSAFDLILCRNVMIYFSPAVIRSIVAQFRDCLVEGGWLVVGHAEPSTEIFRDFCTVSAPGTTLYQKAATLAVPNTPEELCLSLPPLRAAVEWPGPILPRAAPFPPALVVERASPLPGLAQVRRLADRGEWQNAAKLCCELLEQDGLDPAVHFYYALVLEQMGLAAGAEQCLRRAIYLDRKFVLAHYHLGLFLQKSRKRQNAARSFENVLGLLSPHQDDGRFPNGDDITVAELRELTRMHLEVLRG
jgi:chemotaxis protein methyltransferase CheR